MRTRLLAAAVAVLTVAGTAAAGVAAQGAADAAARSRVAAVRAEHAAQRRTAAQVRADRGGTDGFQDPVAATSPAATSAVPTRVVIPAIGVDAVLERLHRDSRGILLPPTVADEAGWWTGGVKPGQVGAAVIAGHLDTVLGDAVFVRLRSLRPGDRILVRMSDGSTVRFAVDSSRVVTKALFPSKAVYGATPDPQLRLITCNEPFDATVGHYADNLVVFAHEV